MQVTGEIGVDALSIRVSGRFVGALKPLQPPYAVAENAGYSGARQNHRTDSDADVAVLLRGQPGEFVPTLLAMADIAYDVLLETGLRMQPLPVR